MRLIGTVRSWNDDRGFGFIAPTHGGAELFMHISALPRDGFRPTVGETVSYELGRGKDGRPQAVNVIRQAVGVTGRRSEMFKTVTHRRRPILPKMIGLVLLLSLGAYGYSQHQKRLTRYSADAQPLSAPSEVNTGAQPESGSFRCDGRTHCSQMTSCTEAKYFLRNCPGTQMDGNDDGVPCEQQWCTSPFAK
ncbi:MAG: cold shock domain-containing protein [Betaproteobacteria bacterium]